MKISIITVGKRHDSQLVDAIEMYTKRVSADFKVEWKIIPSSTIAGEAKKIIAAIGSAQTVVALDERGAGMASSGLSLFISKLSQNGTKQIVFVIGGSYGLDPSVIEHSSHVWSLSPLTFPHQLVRLILIEQLYRACSIMKGGKYHHE